MEDERVTLEGMLGDEIAFQIEKLSELQPGSKEHTMAVKDISELYQALTKGLEAGFKVEEANARLAAEQDRFDKEREDKAKEVKAEAEKDKKAAITDMIFKGLEITVKIAGIVLPLSLYATWLERGMKFEETGSFTSSTFRGFFGKLKPTKVD